MMTLAPVPKGKSTLDSVAEDKLKVARNGIQKQVRQFVSFMILLNSLAKIVTKIVVCLVVCWIHFLIYVSSRVNSVDPAQTLYAEEAIETFHYTK